MAGFNTAITGLKAATTDLDVTGNNIANASTVGFKSSRTEFGDIYTSAVVGAGSSNTPGSGVAVTDIAQDFSAGTVESTNNNLDLAIKGGGFFELADEQGGKSYTRAGAFELDKDGFIVNKTGQFLQGFPVENGVELPLGNLAVTEKESPPQATYEMSLALNIDDRKDASQLLSEYNKDVPASYTYSTTMERVDSLGDSSVIKYNFVEQRPVKEVHTFDITAGTFNLSGLTAPALLDTTSTTHFDATTGQLIDPALSALQDADPRIFSVALDNQAAPTKLIVTFKSDSTQYGDLVAVDGTASLTNESISEVTAGEQHVFNFSGGPAYAAGDILELSVAGVNISIDGGVGGVSAEDIVNEINAQRTAITDSNSNIDSLVYDAANNSLVIGYRADAGDIAPDSLDMQILSGPVDPFGGAVPSGTAIAPDTEVNGDDSYEGTYRLYAYLLNAGANGEDQTLTIGKDPDPGELGSLPEKGPVLINFNQSSGILSEINGVAVTSNLAVPALTVQGFSDNDPILANGTDSEDVIRLDLSNTSQFASASIVKNSSQNGYAKGDLIGVTFGIDGEMVASFSNGQNQTLGVVAIATFENQAGLQPVGDTQWAASLSSGSAITNPPGTGLNGTLKSGSLEQSNVDLSEQLVKLIEAQRNFQANSKTLETLNTVTQAILQI